MSMKKCHQKRNIVIQYSVCSKEKISHYSSKYFFNKLNQKHLNY